MIIKEMKTKLKDNDGRLHLNKKWIKGIEERQKNNQENINEISKEPERKWLKWKADRKKKKNPASV